MAKNSKKVDQLSQILLSKSMKKLGFLSQSFHVINTNYLEVALQFHDSIITFTGIMDKNVLIGGINRVILQNDKI